MVPEFDATLVDEEGRALPLELVWGSRWTCKDVDGAATEMKRNAEAIDTLKLRQAEVRLTMIYYPEAGIRVTYRDNFAADMAGINGATGQLVAWDETTSTAGGEAIGLRLFDDGALPGELGTLERRKATYPEPVSSDVFQTHDLFGLVSPEDWRNAYLCDVGANPLPADLSGLTPGNFVDACSSYYYECDAY